MTSELTATSYQAGDGNGQTDVSPWLNLITEQLQPVNGSVFHYTNSYVLESISRHQRLWASQAASLNDSAEVVQGWERIREMLDGLSRSVTGVNALLEFASVQYRPASDVFILSASTRDDDANQWRLYGGQGSGYAVELDCSARLAVVAEEKVRVTNLPFGILTADAATVSPWLPVIYDDQKLKAVLTEMAANVASEEQRISSDPSAEGREHLSEVLREQIDEALSAVAHLVKSPGFSGESEARVVATLDFGVRHVRFRGSDRGVVGYVELVSAPGTGASRKVVAHDEAVGSILPIRSVCGGLLIRSRDHGRTIEGMCRQRGMGSVAYRESSVPLA